MEYTELSVTEKLKSKTVLVNKRLQEWTSGGSGGEWVCHACVPVLMHHGLQRVKRCTEFKASNTNSSKHNISLSSCHPSWLLSFVIALWPLLGSAPSFLFLLFFNFLSHHLCHICFSLQSCLCRGLCPPSLYEATQSRVTKAVHVRPMMD